MMRKFILINIVIIVVLILTTACNPNTKYNDLAICGSFGVPGMLCADLKGSTFECKILEEDSQKRVLYIYTTQSLITENKEHVAVVCQKRDGDAVYYYEDICYLLGDWTKDDLILLKERNDWNLPLDYSKMTRRSNKITLDSYIVFDGELEYKYVEQSCCEELNIMQTQVVELCLLDYNNANMELYWLVVNRDSGEEYYFALIDGDYRLSLLRVEKSMNALEDLVAFKLNSNWGAKYPQ